MRAAIELITATKSSTRSSPVSDGRSSQAASRCLEKHLDVSPPKTRESIFVLDDDDSTTYDSLTLGDVSDT